MPKFSIMMPCYNAMETLDASIGSIVAQTRRDWELLCIDDCSDDGTLARLQSWAIADQRIRVLRQNREGPSAARNGGMKQAKGEILCFCDADDLWVETKLATLDQAFADPCIGGAYGQIAFFRQTGNADTHSTVGATSLTISELMSENPVCTMSNLSLRKEVVDHCGMLAEALVHNEDLEWLIRLVGMGVIIQPIDQLLVWYRTSGGGLSSDLIKMANSRKLALTTAARFGHYPSRENEAVYLRYLARRALRLERGKSIAQKFTLQGLHQSPKGFLFPLRRGGATVLASIIAPLLPLPISRFLFAK